MFACHEHCIYIKENYFLFMLHNYVKWHLIFVILISRNTYEMHLKVQGFVRGYFCTYVCSYNL